MISTVLRQPFASKPYADRGGSYCGEPSQPERWPAAEAPSPSPGRSEGSRTAIVLVFGGYGGFGARLSRRLAVGGHDVIVAGRSLARAAAFCTTHPDCRPLRADRADAAAPVLAQTCPDLVIDAAGPFQGSGYELPRACIAAGIPYIDLADGRAFVAGIGLLDGAAQAAGVAVLSGASSVPALSGAVARHLAAGMERVTAVETMGATTLRGRPIRAAPAPVPVKGAPPAPT